ncbi:MAG: DUF1697 domain-containing protein [Chloroflexota bacterium]
MPDSPRRYVALLRAVNVGGRSTLRMADLRAQFESLGLTAVSTYIQSGNALFTATDADPERLARRIEMHLGSALGYRGRLFLLTPAQLRDAAASNPFHPERTGADERSHLLFLSSEPEAARREALMARQGEEYRFAIRGKILYYAYPSVLAGRRRGIDFEGLLGVTGTARTWNVVEQLIRLAG